jgi:hypothetical protein
MRIGVAVESQKKVGLNAFGLAAQDISLDLLTL